MSEKNPKPFKPIKEPLTKRERIATQLLAGMLGNHTIKGKEFRQILVTWAVEYADLLIEELNKKLGE